MSKSLKSNQLRGAKSGRVFLAASLALSLAAFGCTTDRTLGDGDPVTTPGVRTTPTGGAATGTESTPVNPPMMSSSSSRFDSALPAVRPRRVSAEEAALLAAERAPRVRVLGPAYPGAPGRPYASEGLVTGQWVNPAMQTNPQLTINSSLTSDPTPGIATGGGEGVSVGGGGGFIASGTSGVTGTTSALGTTTGAAAVLATTSTNSPAATANTGAGVTGTSVANVGSTAGASVFNGAVNGAALNGLASRTLSPTAASVVNPPASISATPGLAATASQRTALTATSTATTTSSTATTNTSGTATHTATASATANVANPVRITTTAAGRRTITNQ